MKHISRAMALAALGLLLTGTARAATLFTPPTAPKSEFMTCGITNVRKTSVHVTIETRQYSGALIGSMSTDVAPGVSVFGADTSIGDYCKFTVNAAKTSVRATATYWSTTDLAPTITVPAK